MCEFLPSEVARLVLGYLEEENCTETYNSFLETCSYLKECLYLKKKGRKFFTNIGGLTLSSILDEYCQICDLVNDTKTQLNGSLSRRKITFSKDSSLYDKVKVLLDFALDKEETFTDCPQNTSGSKKLPPSVQKENSQNIPPENTTTNENNDNRLEKVQTFSFNTANASQLDATNNQGDKNIDGLGQISNFSFNTCSNFSLLNKLLDVQTKDAWTEKNKETCNKNPHVETNHQKQTSEFGNNGGEIMSNNKSEQAIATDTKGFAGNSDLNANINEMNVLTDSDQISNHSTPYKSGNSYFMDNSFDGFIKFHDRPKPSKATKKNVENTSDFPTQQTTTVTTSAIRSPVCVPSTQEVFVGSDVQLIQVSSAPLNMPEMPARNHSVSIQNPMACPGPPVTTVPFTQPRKYRRIRPKPVFDNPDFTPRIVTVVSEKPVVSSTNYKKSDKVEVYAATSTVIQLLTTNESEAQFENSPMHPPTLWPSGDVDTTVKVSPLMTLASISGLHGQSDVKSENMDNPASVVEQTEIIEEPVESEIVKTQNNPETINENQPTEAPSTTKKSFSILNSSMYSYLYDLVKTPVATEKNPLVETPFKMMDLTTPTPAYSPQIVHSNPIEDIQTPVIVCSDYGNAGGNVETEMAKNGEKVGDGEEKLNKLNVSSPRKETEQNQNEVKTSNIDEQKEEENCVVTSVPSVPCEGTSVEQMEMNRTPPTFVNVEGGVIRNISTPCSSRSSHIRALDFSTPRSNRSSLPSSNNLTSCEKPTVNQLNDKMIVKTFHISEDEMDGETNAMAKTDKTETVSLSGLKPKPFKKGEYVATVKFKTQWDEDLRKLAMGGEKPANHGPLPTPSQRKSPRKKSPRKPKKTPEQPKVTTPPTAPSNVTTEQVTTPSPSVNRMVTRSNNKVIADSSVKIEIVEEPLPVVEKTEKETRLAGMPAVIKKKCNAKNVFPSPNTKPNVIRVLTPTENCPTPLRIPELTEKSIESMPIILIDNSLDTSVADEQLTPKFQNLTFYKNDLMTSSAVKNLSYCLQTPSKDYVLTPRFKSISETPISKMLRENPDLMLSGGKLPSPFPLTPSLNCSQHEQVSFEQLLNECAKFEETDDADVSKKKPGMNSRKAKGWNILKKKRKVKNDGKCGRGKKPARKDTYRAKCSRILNRMKNKRPLTRDEACKVRNNRTKVREWLEKNEKRKLLKNGECELTSSSKRGNVSPKTDRAGIIEHFKERGLFIAPVNNEIKSFSTDLTCFDDEVIKTESCSPFDLERLEMMRNYRGEVIDLDIKEEDDKVKENIKTDSENGKKEKPEKPKRMSKSTKNITNEPKLDEVNLRRSVRQACKSQCEKNDRKVNELPKPKDPRKSKQAKPTQIENPKVEIANLWSDVSSTITKNLSHVNDSFASKTPEINHAGFLREFELALDFGESDNAVNSVVRACDFMDVFTLNLNAKVSNEMFDDFTGEIITCVYKWQGKKLEKFERDGETVNLSELSYNVCLADMETTINVTEYFEIFNLSPIKVKAKSDLLKLDKTKKSLSSCQKNKVHPRVTSLTKANKMGRSTSVNVVESNKPERIVEKVDVEKSGKYSRVQGVDLTSKMDVGSDVCQLETCNARNSITSKRKASSEPGGDGKKMKLDTVKQLLSKVNIEKFLDFVHK